MLSRYLSGSTISPETDLPLLLIRRFGRPIVAAHPASRRIEQRHRLAVILMRMFFDMLIAEVAGFILLVEAFNTQPFRWLAAFLANCHRHLVARQQGDRVFAGRLPFTKTHHSNVRLGGGAEIVKMA